MLAELATFLGDAFPEAERRWYSQALSAARAVPGSERALAVAFAGAGRRSRMLGGATVVEAGRRLAAAGGASADCWKAPDVVRSSLLLAAARSCPGDPLPPLVEGLFVRGDNAERIAILMSLALLPDPARFADLAVEACRTNVQDVFEALACENPYPGLYLNEACFNQMVLKAVFVGVELGRINGLGKRRNRELARMAGAYASERRRAGRSVPGDIGLITQPAEEDR